MSGYDPTAIERKWQQVWAEEKTWEVPNPGQPGFDPAKPKSYVLEMLPYPSGEPHVGHLKCYAVGDAIASNCEREYVGRCSAISISVWPMRLRSCFAISFDATRAVFTCLSTKKRLRLNKARQLRRGGANWGHNTQ